VESVTFRSVSVVSSSSLLSSSNFASVRGIEVIVRGTIEVTENRDYWKWGETQNTFRGVSVVSNGSLLSSSNFGSVGGIEMIALSCVPVTVNWNRSTSGVGVEVTQDTFARVSVVSNGSLLSGSDFTSIVGVEVILGSTVEIPINWNHSRERVGGNMPVIGFALISVVSNSTVLSGTDFSRISGIEMVVAGGVPVTVNRNNVGTTTKAKYQVES